MHKRHSRGKEEGTVEKEEENGERRVEGREGGKGGRLCNAERLAVPGAGEVASRLPVNAGERNELSRGLCVALPRWNAKVVTLTRRKPCAVTGAAVNLINPASTPLGGGRRGCRCYRRLHVWIVKPREYPRRILKRACAGSANETRARTPLSPSPPPPMYCCATREMRQRKGWEEGERQRGKGSGRGFFDTMTRRFSSRQLT